MLFQVEYPFNTFNEPFKVWKLPFSINEERPLDKNIFAYVHLNWTSISEDGAMIEAWSYKYLMQELDNLLECADLSLMTISYYGRFFL